MKRKVLILSVLAICAAILAAGTLAYFNAEGTAHNVITTGGVKIAVQEWADEDKTTPFEDLTGIMPGMTVTKIAEIKNTGASDAWVRVKITKNIQLAGEGEANLNLVGLDINTDDWTLGEDGYLYYKDVLHPGEVTAPIFTTVTFNVAMGNEYQNATATVDIAAQAVQTANNGATVMDAKGWPGDPVTPPDPGDTTDDTTGTADDAETPVGADDSVRPSDPENPDTGDTETPSDPENPDDTETPVGADDSVRPDDTENP